MMGCRACDRACRFVVRYRVFPLDVTKIGNEAGGHVGVPRCSKWLWNQLIMAY